MHKEKKVESLINKGLEIIELTNQVLKMDEISKEQKDYLKIKLKNLSFFMETTLFKQKNDKQLISSFEECINNFEEYLSKIIIFK